MAYSFNGTNQSLQTTSSPVANAPLTMACWFNPNDTNTRYSLITLVATPGPNPPFNSGNGHYYMFAAGNVAGDPIIISTDPVGNTSSNSTAGFSANTWNHAAGVFTSNSARTVYLNGGNSATNTNTFAPLTQTQLRIASFAYNFETRLAGSMAEVGIWNAALTAEEIASLADGMTCDKIRPQNLVFYAPLIRDLQDIKGGLTITNNNAATVATHPRVYA